MKRALRAHLVRSALPLLLAPLLMTPAGCNAGASGARAAAHFGAANLDAVVAPDRFVVYRLEPYIGPAADAPGELVAGSAVLRAPAPAPRAGWSEELARLLVKDSSYEWDMDKACEPMSGVLVRYEKGPAHVDVSFCFECEMLSIALVGSQAWEDFDPITRELIALMKEAFPSDPVIEALGR